MSGAAMAVETPFDLLRQAADLINRAQWFRKKRWFARAIEAERKALALSRKARWMRGAR